jgi:hypothetical protein
LRNGANWTITPGIELTIDLSFNPKAILVTIQKHLSEAARQMQDLSRA